MESVVEAAEGSIVPAESAVEGTGANVIKGGELPAPNSTQSSPAAPADAAAAGLAIPTASDNQGEISCLRLLVTRNKRSPSSSSRSPSCCNRAVRGSSR